MFGKKNPFCWKGLVMGLLILGIVSSLIGVARAEDYAQISGHEKFRNLQFSGYGNSLVAKYYDANETYVEFWRVVGSDIKLLGQEKMSQWIINSEGYNITISPDGSRYALRNDKGDKIVVKKMDGSVINTFDIPHWVGVMDCILAFTPDNRRLICGITPIIELVKNTEYTQKRYLLLWNLENGNCLEYEIPDNYARASMIKISPDGQYISTYGWHEVTGKGKLQGKDDQTTLVRLSDGFGVSVFRLDGDKIVPVIEGFMQDYQNEDEEKVGSFMFLPDSDQCLFVQGGATKLAKIIPDQNQNYQVWAAGPVSFSDMAVGPQGRYLFYTDKTYDPDKRFILEYQQINTQFSKVQEIEWPEEKSPKDIVYNMETGEWLVAGEQLYRLKSKATGFIMGEPGSILAKAQELLEVGFTGEAIQLIKDAIIAEPAKDIFKNTDFYAFLAQKYQLSLYEIGDLLLTHLTELLKGEVQLGIGITPSTALNQIQMGAAIQSVRQGSPADLAGITTNCSIQKINQQIVRTTKDLAQLYSLPPGSPVEVIVYDSVLRDFVNFSLKMQLGFVDQSLFNIAIMRLVDYAMLAGNAGQVECIRQAEQIFKDLREQYPLSTDWQQIGKVDILLEAYAIAIEESPDAAYKYLLQHDRLDAPGESSFASYYLLRYSTSWSVFYQDKKKLAYFLGKQASELPAVEYMIPEKADYPDIPRGVIPDLASVQQNLKTEISGLANQEEENVPYFQKLISTGSPAEIKAAINLGEDVNQRFDTFFDSFSVLQWAIMQNREPEVIQLLLEEGANWEEDILFDVVNYNNHFAVLELFIDAGADVSYTDEWNTSPLIIWAVNPGANIQASKEIVERLIELGQDINAVDYTGRSILFSASQNNNFAINKLLLEAGANPNTPNNQGLTPFMEAVKNATPEMIKLFLQYGADPLWTNAAGQTSLMQAAWYNPQPEILDLLIQAGVDPKALCLKGRNALHYAAAYNTNPEVVRYLIEQSQIDPGQGDYNNMTPFQLAISQGDPGVVEELVNLGGDLIGSEYYQDSLRYSSPALALSADGEAMVTVELDDIGYRIRAWQSYQNKYFLSPVDLLVENPCPLNYLHSNLAFSADGKVLVVRETDGTLSKYDVVTGEMQSLRSDELPDVNLVAEIYMTVNRYGNRLITLYSTEEGYQLSTWSTSFFGEDKMINLPLEVVQADEVLLRRVQFSASDKYYIVSGEKRYENSEAIRAFALVYDAWTDKLVNLIDVDGSQGNTGIVDIVLSSFSDHAMVKYFSGDKYFTSLVGLTPGTARGNYAGDFEMMTFNDNDRYLVGQGNLLIEFALLSQGIIPIKEYSIEQELTPVTVTYNQDLAQWVLVCKEEIITFDTAEPELTAAKLAIQARDMVRAGFYEAGLEKAKEAIGMAPPGLTYKNSEYYSSLERLGLPLEQVGELILYQYNLVKDSEDVNLTAYEIMEGRLIDYAMFAVKAGHSDLARDALMILKRMYQEMDSDLNWQRDVRAILVDSMIIAAEEGVDQAYSRIMQEGIFQGMDKSSPLIQSILLEPEQWAILYSNPKKLAYLLNLGVEELPEMSPVDVESVEYPSIVNSI